MRSENKETKAILRRKRVARAGGENSTVDKNSLKLRLARMLAQLLAEHL